MKAVEPKITNIRKLLGVSLVVVLFLALCIPAVKFTIGQALYQQGVTLTEQSSYTQAVDKLTRAAAWQPQDSSIQYELGLVNLRVATNHPSPKDSDAKDHVEWHRVTVFGRTAEVVGMYCHKGDTLFVEGELRTKTWIGRDEQKHFSTEIMARNVQFDMNRRADRDQDGYRSEAVA